VLREKFMAELQSIMTASYKQSGASGWQVTSPRDLFLESGKLIMQMKRREIGLSLLVDRTVASRKKKDQRKVPDMVAKQKRLDNFWPSFHTSHKLKHSRPEAYQHPDGPAREQKLAMQFRANAVKNHKAMLNGEKRPLVPESSWDLPSAWYAHASPTGSAGDVFVSGDDAWKLRGSRATASRGGSRSNSKSSSNALSKSVSFPSLQAASAVTQNPGKYHRPVSQGSISRSTTAALSDGLGTLMTSQSSRATTSGSQRQQSRGGASRQKSDSGRLTSAELLSKTKKKPMESLADWGFASSSPLFQEKNRADPMDAIFEAPKLRTRRPVDQMAWSTVGKQMAHHDMWTTDARRSSSSKRHSLLEVGEGKTKEAVKREQTDSTTLFERHQILQPHEKAAAAHLMETQVDKHSYLRDCDLRFILPSLVPFCTGHSDSLVAVNQVLCDHDLLAVVKMLECKKGIAAVDLQGNSQLTEKSLVPMLEELKEGQNGRLSKALLRLNLRDCAQNSSFDTVNAIIKSATDLISTNAGRLKHLDLSGMRMSGKTTVALCEEMSKHPNLVKVGLADVKLGHDNPLAGDCLKLLTGSGIEVLDLGYNAFDDELFSILGKGAVEGKILERLSIAGCSCQSPNTGSSSIENFLEHLQSDRTLTDVNISFNYIDSRSALVLEASCFKNEMLVRADLSHNPLGKLGFRSILRLLGREASGFSSFDCEGCGSGIDSGDQTVFNETNPGARYNLELWKPYHRAVLRMLYRTCEKYNLSPDAAFVDVRSSSGKYQHPVAKPDGSLPVECEGTLEFTFNVHPAVEKLMTGVKDDAAFRTLIEAYSGLTRIKPAQSKEVQLAAQLRGMNDHTMEQLTMLEALSKDFLFDYPQLVQFCKNKQLVVEVAKRLLPCLLGGSGMTFLSLLKMPSPADYTRFMKEAKNFYLFNLENPTGPYRLKLENCCDHSIAQKVLLIDAWECSIDIAKGREIVSQDGKRSHIRNETWDDKKIPDRCLTEFILPESGLLTFDYASSRKPSAGAQPLDSLAFDRILVSFQKAGCAMSDRIRALATTAHLWHLNSFQLRAIMSILPDSNQRGRVFVALACRLLDSQNEKIFRTRFELDEFQKLSHRLGEAYFFPFIQPEDATFILDFAFYDQRLAANILINLANAENKENLREVSYVSAEGEDMSLVLGIPATWAKLELMPTSGVFKTSYACSADERKLDLRNQNLEKYGYCRGVQEQSVVWWSSITACPEDVVKLVEFINSNFADIWKPFEIIDGEGGNGELTLSKMTDGLKSLNCNKFRGPDENGRIKEVFRYLDPSGEGIVSKQEWMVLEQLFREVKLSVKEFVEFCERTFGPNLDDTWKALDVDGSGDIDFQEWSECLKKQGFFGMPRPIFAYIDKDDGGTVSKDEFEILADYQKPGWSLF